MSLSPGDEVPHIFTRKSRVQPGEFLITSAKRLLQQYRHEADVPARGDDVCSWGKTGRHMLVESLRAIFGSIYRTCLSPLVTDRAMEAWYHPFIA